MENRNTQKFVKKLPLLVKARRYYSLMLALNDMHLGKGELDFLVFIASYPTVPFSTNKRMFMDAYSKGSGVTDNIIGKLRRLKLLTGTQINPYAFPDFSQPIVIQIVLENGEAI